MTKVEEREQDAMALSRSELAALGDGFQSYLADEWGRQIKADAQPEAGARRSTGWKTEGARRSRR